MLKSLNSPFARCVAKCSRRLEIGDSEDDVLERELLLCRGECVMLTCNLWVAVGPVNGALGYIENIFFAPGLKPLQLLELAIVVFYNYYGVPFNRGCLIIVPIAPIIRGNLIDALENGMGIDNKQITEDDFATSHCRYWRQREVGFDIYSYIKCEINRWFVDFIDFFYST